MPCSADQLTGFLRSLHEKGVDEPCKQFSSAGSAAPHPREHSRWARGRRRARARSARLSRLHIRGSAGRRGCYSSGVAAGARADPEAAGGPRSPRAGQPRLQRREAAWQRRRHVSGHRGSGLGDGKCGRAGGPPRSLQDAGAAGRGAGWGKAAPGRRLPVTAAITVAT